MADIPDSVREGHEHALDESLGVELTDEQLHQLAEGATSWGANCMLEGRKIEIDLKKLIEIKKK